MRIWSKRRQLASGNGQQALLLKPAALYRVALVDGGTGKG
jgi:hypothetical protein